MAQITYFPEIECLATPSSLHDTQVVTVNDAAGSPQFLRVARGFLTEEAGKRYLPVRVIEVDRHREIVLVQLPYEADSGVNRIWVPLNQFRKTGVEASRKTGIVA